MALEKITQANIEAALRYKVEEIRRKPEYLWADDRRNHKVNDGGEAAVKAAVANCALDFDLWKGLRNPALIGRHPVGLRDIWEYYASIILFDAQEPITDGSEGVVHVIQAWRERINSLSDFTDVRPEVNRQRYCTYIPDQGWQEERCGLCVQYCPSGTVGNSVPQPNGEYAEAIARQAFQFSDGYLQFDFARCLEDRTQKAQLHPDYVCARCVAICAARGKRRVASSSR